MKNYKSQIKRLIENKKFRNVVSIVNDAIQNEGYNDYTHKLWLYASEHLENAKEFELSMQCSDFYVQDLIREGQTTYKDRTLYAFRPVNIYTINDIIHDSITVSNPNSFNDPLDPLVNKAIDIKGMKDTSLGKSFEKIRIKCFSESRNDINPYENILMWSHYADSHKGICIKYNFTSNFCKNPINNPHKLGCFQNVIYNQMHLNLRDCSKLTFNECFLYKKKVWKYENEVRYLFCDYKTPSDYYNIQLAPSNSTMDSIYFGAKCSSQNMNLVKSIVKRLPYKIKMYKMNFDETDIFSLKKLERID